MYTTVKVKCRDQALQVNAPRLASGGVNEIRMEVSFCPLWNGMAKTAVFYTNPEKQYTVLLVDDACIVPAEVAAQPGTVYFGIFGIYEDTVRTTEVMRLSLVQGPPLEGQEPADPTPDVYQQLLTSYAETQRKLAGFYMIASDDGTGVLSLKFETLEDAEGGSY